MTKTLEEKQDVLLKLSNSFNKKPYESIMVLKPNIDIQETIGNITSKILELGFFIENIDNIGIKNLAYELRGNSTGYYVQFNIWGNNVNELEEIYRAEKNILKFITVQVDF